MRYILSPITCNILHRVTVLTVLISQIVLCSYGITLQLKQKCFIDSCISSCIKSNPKISNQITTFRMEPLCSNGISKLVLISRFKSQLRLGFAHHW